MDGGQSISELFKPEYFVLHRNTYIHDDISGIIDPWMTESPNTTAEAIMDHANLQYDEIRVVNKGVCLNYNLLGICNDANCSH